MQIESTRLPSVVIVDQNVLSNAPSRLAFGPLHLPRGPFSRVSASGGAQNHTRGSVVVGPKIDIKQSDSEGRLRGMSAPPSFALTRGECGWGVRAGPAVAY